eukprot:snap_masked-scaffold_31-processed-gene-0.0-mRNA-1 protein AED:1.00 eAED:1.00 QI:0/-1/0/0/-1/1/1/0/345
MPIKKLEECLQVLGSSCAPFGNCQNSTCVCDNGWDKTEEFMFAFDFSQSSVSSLPCSRNLNLLISLYIIGGLSAFLVLCFYLKSISKLSQLKRLSFLLLGFGLFSSVCLYRAFRINDEFNTPNYFSIGTVISYFLTSISTVIFMNRYVQYVNNTIHVRNKTTRRKIKAAVGSERVVILSCVIGFLANFTAIVSIDPKVKLQAFRLGYLMYACLSIYILIPGAYLITLLIRAVDFVLDQTKTSSGRERLEITSRAMKQVRSITLVEHVSMFVFWTLGATTITGMDLLKYAMPAMMVLGSIHALVVSNAFKVTTSFRGDVSNTRRTNALNTKNKTSQWNLSFRKESV